MTSPVMTVIKITIENCVSPGFGKDHSNDPRASNIRVNKEIKSEDYRFKITN